MVKRTLERNPRRCQRPRDSKSNLQKGGIRRKMTKYCKCGHQKGEHKFYTVSSWEGLYSCCHHKEEGDKDICGCEEFWEVENKGDKK